MIRSALPALGVVVAVSAAGAQEPRVRAEVPGDGAGSLATRAEATRFVETSRYADVIDLVDRLVASSDALHRADFGYTVEGRRLPLVVWDPASDPDRYASATAIRGAGLDRLRVLVFANIHAGEVAGKEAALILLRDLAGGLHDEWADRLLLAVAPIYNADGNERIALDHRPLQNGPVGGMGQRPNAHGLDLNRDFTKLEAPETRSLVRLIDLADFDLVVDLHTTDGTIHGYHLTYAPPLHPSTDPAIDRYLRDQWLPAVTRALAEEPGAVAPGDGGPLSTIRREGRWNAWHYGNLPGEAGAEGRERGWYTYDARPRFGINAVGLRNRFGILSEAYAYLPFRERIAVSLRFVEEILDFAAANAGEIRGIVEAADGRSVAGDSLALASELALTDPAAPILLGEVERERHPFTGAPILRRLDAVRTETMPAYVAFRPAAWEVAPAAYLIPAERRETIALLEAHGIETRAVEEPGPMFVEWFRIDASETAEREFQGHHVRRLRGEWVAGEREIPADAVAVPMDQPLARLAFVLLEPASDDGLVAWNVLDAALEGGATYPILRIPCITTRTGTDSSRREPAERRSPR